jgi:hypothetical protein
MFSYLTEKMGVAADEAEILAEEFSNDISALNDYAQAQNRLKEQTEAAYASIASSAQ